jgi:hypothetical protein
MAIRKVLRLTFDTCCINLRRKSAALNGLEQLCKQGVIEIAATPEMLIDLERDKSSAAEQRRKKASLLHKEIHDQSRKDEQRYSFEGLLEDPITRQKVERGLKHWLDTLFPSGRPVENMADDILHVLIHTAWGRDMFVTTDKGILKRKEKFKALGAVVCCPEEALERVKEHVSSA